MFFSLLRILRSGSEIATVRKQCALIVNYKKLEENEKCKNLKFFLKN